MLEHSTKLLHRLLRHTGLRTCHPALPSQTSICARVPGRRRSTIGSDQEAQAVQEEREPQEQLKRSDSRLSNESSDSSQSPSVGTKPSRADILRACAGTSLGFTAVGAIIRTSAKPLASIIPITDSEKVQALLANPIAAWHWAAILGLVAAVTSGRAILLQLWPDYAAASDTSNEIVLSQMSGLDIIFLSFLPGFSEELLFNGALVPAFGATWPAVAVTGAIFGVLHRGGGRNWAFALWAVFIGWLYGASYLWTQDLLVPAFTHSLANVASAALWVQRSKKQ